MYNVVGDGDAKIGLTWMGKYSGLLARIRGMFDLDLSVHRLCLEPYVALVSIALA